ncbi:hypothetical protein CAPTEDRAFT_180450 [Capitella teleta]|uniref:Peptidase S54 rhomboid domain-containing protein n=1 Tax=Capitella teleta TaxID=283909 RepID=R7TMM8_CAPTE|nr:hypothetical protein CAPTEDRAFT_180450 [Capitella teleta]|eukprot:ELT92325.1 hypothetical protein CAPTEDRAFT_180450 [Capitella teleta]
MRGQRAPGLAIGLLVAQILHMGVDRVPPVTLGAIAAQVAIFLRLVKLPFGDIHEVCVSSLNVWYRGDWKRLFLASFYHLDEWHLYFNMVSMLWKGVNLERRLGSAYFAYMVLVFSVLTNAILVGLGVIAEEILHDHSYISTCAAGFSGVLFALKVVAAHLSPPTTQYVMNIIPVNSRLACWAELLLIHILVPNSSFVGHLAGILVGLLYIKGPLKYIMHIPMQSRPSYTYHSQRSGFRGTAQPTGFRRTAAPPTGAPPPQENQQAYHDLTGGLSEEEQMARAMQDSMQNFEPSASPMEESHPPPYPTHPGFGSMPTHPPPPYSEVNPTQPNLYPDLRSTNEHNEEIRRRRLERFNR